MASTASFRLLRLDRSWIETLRAMRVHAVEDPFAASPSVWLQWAFVGEQRGSLLRWLEAIELFVLLARANCEAWRAAVVELRNSSYYSFARAWTELVLEPRELPRVSGYEVVCSETDDAEHLCAFLAARVTQRSHTSPEYNHMRVILEGEMENEAPRGIPVQLRYNPRRPWRSSIVGLLPQLAALAKSQQESAHEDESGSSSRKLRSRVTSVYNEISTFTRADESFLRLMVEIKANGIDFVDLPQLNYASIPQQTVFLMTALHQLLGTRSCGHAGGVRRVFLSDKTPAPIAEALLSVVKESPSLREVYFNFEESDDETSIEERRRTLQWMAYSLFSAHAENTLSKMTLRCRFLTSTHVDIVRNVLVADDPLQELFPTSHDSFPVHKDTSISTSRITLSDPQGDNITVLQLDDAQLEGLVALGHTNEWWSVLLPGWGQAWVQQDDARVTTRQTPLVPVKIRPNIQLELAQFEAQAIESMLSFLCVIGSNVVKLRLLDRERALDSWCPDVFDACPNLEEFVLWEAVPDRLTVFADSYVESRCQHLKRLFIGVELLTEAAHQEIVQLFHSLADDGHPMAKRLDALEIDVFCTIEGNDIVDSSVLDVVLDMLDKNVHLSKLKLYLPLASTDMGAMHDISDALMMHHAELLPSPIAPLGHREKAALLSVVWGRHEQQSHQSTAMAKFDQRILSTIVEFVPNRKLRLVHVAMPRPAEPAQE